MQVADVIFLSEETRLAIMAASRYMRHPAVGGKCRARAEDIVPMALQHRAGEAHCRPALVLMNEGRARRIKARKGEAKSDSGNRVNHGFASVNRCIGDRRADQVADAATE
jgi:hypothetical protein